MNILNPEFKASIRALPTRVWRWLRLLAGKGLNGLKGAAHRVAQDVVKRPWFLAIAIVIGIGMGFWLGLRAGVLWFVFLAFAFYDWENRVIGVAAILCLVSCPILLQLKLDDQAETMAVYAYFFLAMTVALQLIEFKRFPDRFPEEDESSSESS